MVCWNRIDDHLGNRGLMLDAPVTELGARQAGAGQQYFMAAEQSVADVGEEHRIVFSLALVLVVAAGFDALGLHMLTVKHDYVGFRMIHPDNGVKSIHEMLS